MNTIPTRNGKWMRRSAWAIMAIIVAFAGWAYLYDMPGGIADWRYSKASEFRYTIKIPIGQTPEEAVRKFRRNEELPVMRRETAEGGMLLFYKQPGEEEKINLKMEYVRQTWLGGWKWAMGGGYAQSNPPESEEALNVMSMPKYEEISGPFPILFGNVTDAAVESIVVKAAGKDAGSTLAEIAPYGADRRLWYAVLPPSAKIPYEIKALNGEGEVIAAMTTNDVHYAGSVLKNH